MSSEKREQATYAFKEEQQARHSGVASATADVGTYRLSARQTEDGGSTVVAVGEELEGKRVEAGGSDATPSSDPDIAVLRSQLQLTDGRKQEHQDRVEASDQVEVLPNGSIVLDGAVSRAQQGPSQNKTTSIGPHVGTQASYAVTAFPTDVHHVPSERSCSAPPTSRTRSVPSAIQQGDYKQPGFDDVRRSSWPSCNNQPQRNARVDVTSDHADDARDGIEAYKPYYDDLLYIISPSMISLDQPASGNPQDPASRILPLPSNSAQEQLGGAFVPPKPYMSDRIIHDWPSTKVHQEMEDRRPTPPVPTGPGNLAALPEVSSMSDDDKLDGTALGAAIDAARTQLFVTLTRRHGAQSPKTATLNLATAQRLVLADFQRQITETCHEIVTTKKNTIATDALRVLDSLLDNYCMKIASPCAVLD